MFFNEEGATKACMEEPSQVFKLISEDDNLIKKLVDDKIVDVNINHSDGDSLAMKVLKSGNLDLTLDLIKNTDFDVNYANNNGETIGHLIALYNDVAALPLFKTLKRKKKFNVNVLDNNNESILDYAIRAENTYIINKTLERDDFISFDIYSFSKLYDAYLNNNNYAFLSKIDIIDSVIKLDKRKIKPRMQELVNHLKDMKSDIKNELEENNKINTLDTIMNECVYQYIGE